MHFLPLFAFLHFLHSFEPAKNVGDVSLQKCHIQKMAHFDLSIRNFCYILIFVCNLYTIFKIHLGENYPNKMTLSPPTKPTHLIFSTIKNADNIYFGTKNQVRGVCRRRYLFFSDPAVFKWTQI